MKSASLQAGKDGKRLEELARRLVPRTTWHATRIMSWTPHCRQFKVCSLCSATRMGDGRAILPFVHAFSRHAVSQLAQPQVVA